MHISNLFFVVTRDYVVPFYFVGEKRMNLSYANDSGEKWDWLSSTHFLEKKIKDRDQPADTNIKDYKDLVINVTKERLR